MLECLVDGELSDRVSVLDRGLQYGDGVFETLAVFQRSARRLCFSILATR